MQVKIMFGTIRQGEKVHNPGDIIELPESKLPRFGPQVRVVEKKSAQAKGPEQPPVSEPPFDPEPEPEQQPIIEEPEQPAEKKKGK